MKALLPVITFLLLLSNCETAGDGSQGRDSHTPGKMNEYSGRHLQTIGFPIGGVATGNIILGGRGNISELEIFNKSAKGQSPYMTFFSVWAQAEGEGPVAKILERQFLPPYVGWMGFPRDQLAGVSRFEEVVFKGEYPFAEIAFIDDHVPVEVSLEAYNPYIPLSPEKSGIPAAIFNWKIRNPLDTKVSVSIAFSMSNPIKTSDDSGNLIFGNSQNEYIEDNGIKGIRMSSHDVDKMDLDYGNIVFATTEDNIDVQTRWYRGIWFDAGHVFWDDFADDGRMKESRETVSSANNNVDYWNPKPDVATLLVALELKPNEERTVPFYLSWYFPNRKEQYWIYIAETEKFQNYYSTRFDGAGDVAKYLAGNIEGLYQDTKTFHDILYTSSYPSYVVDAISSQMSSLKTNLVIRNEKGEFYGWEGQTDVSGCCFGSCTHVWNYEQTLAYLFPSLERSMREITLLHDTFKSGYQSYRSLYPPSNTWFKYRPAVDGQMGTIIQVYREWKLSGNTEWLKTVWPKVKASLEIAWKGVGAVDDSLQWQNYGTAMPWDPDKDGVMEGQQHNTYDVDFYGPNTMVGSLYLGALKAAAEMAQTLGESEKSDEYLDIYKKGSDQYDELLWNGEYYVQKIDVLQGLEVPEEWRTPETGGTIIPKYQYGDGCLSDQLLGQYLAHVTGLGYLLDKTHVDQAMKSVYKYNFRNDLSEFSNVQRIYALNDEQGLLLCSWPKGNRPALPFIYSDEVWTGIEYQVAASLIYSGHINEGLTIVKAVRDRYNGLNRNPWDEFECGHHYSRAMSSWAVMLALSGYQYDGVNHSISFSPRINQKNFKTFWSSGHGWGSFTLDGKTMILKVEYGSLKVSKFGISDEYKFKSLADIRGKSSEMQTRLDKEDGLLCVLFENLIELNQGDELVLVFR
ncbi:GH116 family glycosyl-hydrolase [Candidatus Neomarinimicrobiota bacterium]